MPRDEDLLSDSNPMVVANEVAALSEINESSPTGSRLVELNTNTINKLLTALNECTEWGQVFILDSLSNYSPKDEREAQSICERIAPRLDVLFGGGPEIAGPAPTTTGLLADIFGLSASPTMYTPPKICWLPADKGKGLEIWGTYSRRSAQISMDLTLTNKAMQAMSGFAVQFNKNSFGVAPAGPLKVGPLQPSQSLECSLHLNTMGPVQRMEAGVTHATLSLKTRSVEVAQSVFQAYDSIIRKA